MTYQPDLGGVQEYFLGAGGVFNLYTALTGEHLPGATDAAAQVGCCRCTSNSVQLQQQAAACLLRPSGMFPLQQETSCGANNHYSSCGDPSSGSNE